MHTLNQKEVLGRLKSSEQYGLNDKQVEERQKRFGKNEFAAVKKKSFAVRFFAQFADFMILVLIAAAILSFLVSVWNGETDFTDPVIILAIVVLNAILGVVQEEKAEKSLEALKKLSAPTAKVLRNGTWKEIGAVDLVPGDIISVEAGDYVPADARLLDGVNLKVDESALTGESVPVKKNAKLTFPPDTLLGDRGNMLFSTSIVTNGHGKAVLTETGMDTEVGKIASMILTDSAPATPLQKRLAVIGKWLGAAALGICILIFVMGSLQGRELFDMFMTSVSLAVAAIPEALPGMVTIMLSLGVQRMAAKKAVVKRLPAVETLGSATWICSDKTGTLTQNEMTVVKLSDGSRFLAWKERASLRLLKAAALCCNVQEKQEAGRKEFSGEATEKALVAALKEAGGDYTALKAAAGRVAELPFDSARKCMTTVHEVQGKRFSITKGAPDFLLSKCTYYDQDGKRMPMTAAVREKIKQKNLQMTEQALRVLAVAYKTSEMEPLGADAMGGLEEHLVFLGLAGMMDPPRREAKDCVTTCKEAGITPVMITGDHVKTACAVAKEIGILTKESQAVTGEELNKMSQEELAKKVREFRVFARVSPEHKVRIVKALQSAGEVVAMTGDGVNDAPALKAADIGCAMGKGGTDVAKNAADMVLLDDNFATIVEAVKEGRGIYDNIKKSIHFLLSCNIGEIITIFVAILCRLPAPLAAVQLLWVNLVTDSLPAIALGVEKPERDIMKRAPVPPEQGVFTKELVGQMIIEGIMIGMLSQIGYLLGGSTYAFGVLAYAQLFHAFNMRSSRSLSVVGITSNPKMNLAFVICGLMQAVVFSVPMLAKVFEIVTPGPIDWLIILGLSIVPIPVVELQKKLRERGEH